MTAIQERQVYQQHIRDIYEHLSPGYCRIADFLLEHYQEAAFMTAAQVGRASNVDTTLVVRFAQRLGYPGYPELIAEIRDDVKRDLRAVYEPTPADDSPLGVLRRTLTQDRNNLEYMLLHMDAGAVETVVTVLNKATRIFVSGEGNAVYLAQAFAGRLMVLGFNAHTVPSELAGQAATVAIMKPGDVVVGLGTTSMTPSVAVLLKVARAGGAQTIGIVGSLTNPVASAAEHVLLAPAHTIGIMPSWTAFAAITHGLSQALAVLRGDPSAEWIMRTDHLLQVYAEALRDQIPSARQALPEYNAGLASKAG
jgi:DNA-binding MurR/RpiR family transcriptional regulator